MRLNLPALILAAFSTLGLAGLVVGTQFARRESMERIERERGSLEQLAHELSTELSRLDALYDSHLRSLLDRADKDTGGGFTSACRDVIGVRHFTRLNLQRRSADVQIDCRWPGMASVPVPVFEGSTLFPGIKRREIEPAQLVVPDGGRTAWLREPSNPALFFKHHEGSIFVLTIEEAEVHAAIDGWLREWLRTPFSNVSASNEPDRVISPRKEVLAATGEVPSAPADWVLPMRSQFGTWRIESWDRREVSHAWHAPTLAWSAAGSVAIILLGLALAARARDERRLAEQRVSFVNRVSHELRTPLTNMMLHLDVAAEHIDDLATAQRLSLVREEASRLSRLIENVLTFSRRDRGIEVKARAGDPSTVLDTVIAQFTPSLSRRGVQLEYVTNSMRRCLLDGDALAQIIANLLSNVEKYAAPGIAELRIGFERDEFVLTLADNGPGIPAAASERIFQPFERLDSRVTEGVTGTGLGLAIARELAHRMNGSLRLLPSSRGAVFELRVPAPVIPDLGSFAA